MIVECINREILMNFSDKVVQNEYNVTIGRQYLVYGLQFNEDGSKFIEHLSDSGNLSEAPFELFKIIDGQVSKYWKMKIWEDGNVTMWPLCFYKEFYHDDLSEGVEENVKDLIALTKLLEEEQEFKQFSPLN